MNNQSRIMITTSSRVASCMTAQGFNIKVRDFKTGRFIPFEVLDATIDTSGIWSIDEVNREIVERMRKDTIPSVDNAKRTFMSWAINFTGTFRFVYHKRNDCVVSENHTIYDKVFRYSNGDSSYSHYNSAFQCDKRNLCWLNKCYEIYA